MIIRKIDNFWTDEDRAELKIITSETDKLDAEITALTKQIEQARIDNPNISPTELLEKRKDLSEKMLNLDHKDQIAALNKKIKQRYIDSYKENPTSVYDTIKETLQAYTKEDFITQQEKQKASYDFFKNAVLDKEVKKLMEENIKENFNNCFNHLYMILLNEFAALEYYNLPSDDALILLEVKARTFYPAKISKKKISLDELEKNSILFNTIRQGNTTNTLAKFRGRDMVIDDITHEATFKKGNFILKIPNYTSLAGLKTSTQQLLDIINIELTESGAKSPTVKISLSDYMAKRGLKDKKAARNQVRNDLELLKQANITAEQRKGKNTVSYKFINIADSGEIDNGIITFTFGNSFYNMLLSYPIMPYPTQLLKINGKLNPNSTPFGRKIAEHKNMNIGKPNENIISVKTLLNISNLPTYEELKTTTRHYQEKIITPFERDLDALSDTFKWHYCHSNNQPLSDEELKALNYTIFEKLFIFIEWNEYPDQTKRLEKRQEKIDNAIKNKKSKTAKS